MNTVVIGNIISFSGAILMVMIGLLKERKTILTVQCLQFGLMGIANYILGGVTGAISSLVSIVRNLVCQRWQLNIPLKIVFITVQILLSVRVNTMGVIGWLPIASACFYTWMIDTKDEAKLKVVIIAAQAMWLIYDFTIANYVSFLFDIFTIISNFIGIMRLKNGKS